MNSCFKIISKLLANRLAVVLPYLIDKTQSEFIQGRSILGGIVLTKEVIHHCKRTKKDGFLLKLDFEKAYDMVSWDCLMEVIQSSGFGDRWTQWIKIWLISSKIQMIVNREVGRENVCKRGLCQGDPLSPLLFVLIADGLNRLIRKTLSAGLMKGLPGGKNFVITNLQYADDTLICCESRVKGAVVMKWVLCCFEVWSDLRINYKKSSMIGLGPWAHLH